MALDSAPFRRTYLCRLRGQLRRADASTPSRELDIPECCNAAMQNLMHEQAVAATQLTLKERVTWITAGGHFVRRGGKRP
jgi:hypothetical protein